MTSLEAAALLDTRAESLGNYRPQVGLIGCGEVTSEHLRAYRAAGISVAALCDRHLERAERRRSEFYPEARVYTDYRELLRNDSIEVVDLATHPDDRVPLIGESIAAGKHVLSQKPFVMNLDLGLQLVEAADRRGLVLAVNQNGRFAPHFRYLRRLVAAGVLGQTFAAHLRVHWDHTWTRGRRFEQLRHLLLGDFGIHWFDMIRCLLPSQTPERVFATVAHAPGQDLRPPLLAQALVEFDSAQASLAFDGAVVAEPLDTTFVAGTGGNAISEGPDLSRQTVTVRLPEGQYRPPLDGGWFPDGFGGTMVELLRSIEQRRPCEISAADNLASLELCFAAIASADSGLPVRPGSVRVLERP